MRTLILSLIALAPLIGAEGGAGGAGGGNGGAGGNGGLIMVSPLPPEKLKEVEASLTPAQRQLVDDAVALQCNQADPAYGENRKALRDILLTELAQTDAPGRTRLLEALAKQIEYLRRKADPFSPTAAEKAAAATLPPTVAATVERLATGSVDEALAARRSLLGLGVGARVAILERARKAAPESGERLRLTEAADAIEQAYATERLLPLIDGAYARAAALTKERPDARIAVLVSRSALDLRTHPDESQIAALCYFSFTKAAHLYSHAMSIEFGNGPASRELCVRCYGGQEHEILDLGDARPAPASWEAALAAAKKPSGGERATAVKGHRYAERLLSRNDGIDGFATFTVLDVSDDWCVIAW
jgi:hypothetical protein